MTCGDDARARAAAEPSKKAWQAIAACEYAHFTAEGACAECLDAFAADAVALAVKDEQYLRRIKEACLESAEKEVEQQAEENARLRAAAQALLDQMDVVHADGRYASVWGISQMHVGPYTGPKYDVEMDALRDALRAPGQP